LRSFLAISLTLLMAAGCASNEPAFKTGLPKSPSPQKLSKQKAKKNARAKRQAFAKKYREKLPAISSGSISKKIHLPTVSNKKDGALMVLIDSGVQQVSRLNLPARGVIRAGIQADIQASRPKVFRSFYMDRLETTVSQYKKFDGQYDEKSFTDGKECPDCPAMGIDWMSAHRYCLWAGKRLPTEAQWMASAGGGANNPWPWGPEFLPEKANLWGDRDGSSGVAKVGSYPQGASPYGVMDAVGNVWEWVSDSYVAPGNESKKVRLRIVKGGGWTSAKQQAGISSRNVVDPEIKNPTIGFRCAKPINRKK
jgi:formylglycine-generating enzyme required for sulfatase activity